MSPTREPLLPSPVAPAALRLLRASGLDASAFAARAELDADAEARDEVCCTPSSLETLLGEAALALGAGFSARLALGRHALGLVAARHARDGEAALARAAASVPLLVPNARGASERVIEGIRCSITLTTARDHHTGELLLELTRGVLSARGARARVAHVELTRPRPARIDALEAHFGTRELSFGRACAAITLARDGLDEGAGADPSLAAVLDPTVDFLLAQRPSPQATVRERVLGALREHPDASRDVEELARVLRTSARSLQRHLAAEGERFSALVDHVRCERALALLRDEGCTVSEVAGALGYADGPTFARAFKRGTGEAPRSSRRRA